MCGCAMEARLYAEDPAAGFLPSTGPLTRFRLSGSVRIDSGVEEGGEVNSFYDPMIAKIIAAAPTRSQAAARLAEACSRVEVWPVKTNAGFLVRTLSDPDFVAADIHTSFIEDRLDRLLPPIEPTEEIVESAASVRLARERVTDDPWSALRGIRLNAPPHVHVRLQMGETCYQVKVGANPAPALPTRDFGDAIVVFARGNSYAFSDPRQTAQGAGPASGGKIISPMPGRIVAVCVKPGDAVAKGQPLVTLEAMKIEHTLQAAFNGTVKSISLVVGNQVSEGVVLARIAPDL
jgi:3-methylcrotonyl-CoA carboxylase alpha subunit